MDDLIERQALIDAHYEYCNKHPKAKFYVWSLELIQNAPTAQPEIIRCKDCKKAPKCYGDVLMKSKGGGYIYCPVEYCSKAERRTDG